MKKYIIISILLVQLLGFSQNPAFYKTHPTQNNISWYYQLNTSPVVIQHGVVTSENTQPNWYGAFEFLACPGIFNTVDEAYGYLTTNPSFLDSEDYSYYNRNHLDQQVLHIQKDMLNRSIAYLLDEEAKKDFNDYLLSHCRKQIIFGELYIKLNNEEFVLLFSSSMYLFGLDSNSATDISMVLNQLKRGDLVGLTKSGLETSFLLKENGIWKYGFGDKIIPYLMAQTSNLDFAQSNGRPIIHIESSVDASGNRISTIKNPDREEENQLLKVLTFTPKSSSLYQRDGFDNSDISYPTNINEKITSLLDVFISTDDSAFRANTACQKYLSEYKVKSDSSHLVSLEKTVSGTSCSTPLVVDTDYFNFFETDYGVVYSVNIKKNSYVISEINKISASKSSCNYNSSTAKAYLFFDANKPKLVVKNQSCSDTIDLDINQLEFVFTDTTVNLIKNNTYILN